MKIGFDNDRYVQLQSEKILERIRQFDNKLYLEFGGKLFDDMHACRVLPGFESDAKCRILLTLKEQSEIIFVISGADLERNKIRADFGIPETTKPLVVVTAPGPGSGKLATCLSQLYHEYKRGVRAGYAKFETFPIWNLPLRHPVNVAYEAATADLGDINMIDPYHLEAYGETTVNYNRDIECFPIVRSILAKITGDEDIYKSPTDMGVNMAGFGIVDDEVVRSAARQEIVRRYFKAECDYKMGNCTKDTVERIRLLMNENKLSVNDRAVVKPALEKAESAGCAAVALDLEDGTFVTGKSNKLMTACASAVLNAIKTLSRIADDMLLLSPIVLSPIIGLKKDVLREDKVKLSLGDVLTALSICAATNPIAEKAMSMLVNLRDCEAHSSCILPEADQSVMRKLGIRLTCEPEYGSKDLYGF